MPEIGKPPGTPSGTCSAPSAVRRWLPLLALAAVMAIALHQGWHRHLSLDWLAANEQGLREFVATWPALAVIAYAMIYVAAVALSLPGALALTLAGGYLFGWLIGGLVTVAAATAGASLIFLVARSTLGQALAARAGPRLAALRDGFQRDGLSYLLFLRLVPAFPFWLVNLAPALLGLKLTTFVVGTFLGIIPGTFAFAVIGSGLGSLIGTHNDAYQACLMRGEPDHACSLAINPAALLSPSLLVAFAAIGILALAPIVARRLIARSG